MYTWYKNSTFCIAYLYDVKSDIELDESNRESDKFEIEFHDSDDELNDSNNELDDSNNELDDSSNELDDSDDELDASFEKSVWFTRSWTLQELLAPANVIFFDGDWRYIGNKLTKKSAISTATGIPPDAVTDFEPSRFSICEKMSWAADRNATRSEDIAYSLMGIFEINMPLLYGEGSKAFTRLQEEIVRCTGDKTFLLWGSDSRPSNLFASRPRDFQTSQGLQKLPISSMDSLNLTSNGLQIQVSLARVELGMYGMSIGQHFGSIYLMLRKIPGAELFYRAGIRKTEWSWDTWERRRTITLLRQRPLETHLTYPQMISRTTYGFDIRTDYPFRIKPIPRISDDHRRRMEEDAEWVTETDPRALKCRFIKPVLPSVARLTCFLSSSHALWLDLTFDFDSRPCLLIRKEADAIRLFKNLRAPPVYSLSDCFEGSMQVMEVGLYNKVELWDILDEQSGSVSYFLRTTPAYDICARLPPELTPHNVPVWLYLFGNYDPLEGSFGWQLSISRMWPTR